MCNCKSFQYLHAIAKCLPTLYKNIINPLKQLHNAITRNEAKTLLKPYNIKLIDTKGKLDIEKHDLTKYGLKGC